MEMKVIHLMDDVTCVRLDGRMDTLGVDQIELKFSASAVAQGRNTIVDLSQVSFLTSMGIRLLIASARALQLKGKKFVLFGASELVLGILDTVALDQIVPIVATEQLAIQSINS